jgi:hypothetical protein
VASNPPAYVVLFLDANRTGMRWLNPEKLDRAHFGFGGSELRNRVQNGRMGEALPGWRI